MTPSTLAVRWTVALLALGGAAAIALSTWLDIDALAVGIGAAGCSTASLIALAVGIGRMRQLPIIVLAGTAAFSTAVWGLWLVDCGLSCRHDVCRCSDGNIEAEFNGVCQSQAAACASMCARHGGGTSVAKREQRAVLQERERQFLDRVRGSRVSDLPLNRNPVGSLPEAR